MYKKTIYILLIFLFSTSCNTMSSVKRGITGEKSKSADEFMVKKKDPLILPPDYENLPTPDEQRATGEEISMFQKSLESATEDNSNTSGSVEDSILKKIRSK